MVMMEMPPSLRNLNFKERDFDFEAEEELSDKEKEKVEEALFELQKLPNDGTDETRTARADWEAEINILGSRAVPHLKFLLNTREDINKLEIVNAIARVSTEDNIDDLLEMTCSDQIIGSRLYKEANNLIYALIYVAEDIKKADPNDPRLEKIRAYVQANGTAYFNLDPEFRASGVWRFLVLMRTLGADENGDRIDLAETNKRIAEVDEFLAPENIEPTALPAIKLYLYNKLGEIDRQSPEQLSRLREQIHHLSQTEQEYAQTVHLPTEGIEIELPQKYLTLKNIAILDGLSIPNYLEEALPLHEVNPHFSYSPSVQNRILQELAVLGTIPLVGGTEERGHLGKVPVEESISVHVNFGATGDLVPDDFKKGIGNQNLKILNDALTYAFSSPERILKRKTTDSFDAIGDGSASRKSKAIKSGNTQKVLGVCRIELRAGEFKDFPTFRLLQESQLLMSMFLAGSRETNGEELADDQERRLASLWKNFREEFEEILSEYKLKSGKNIPLDLVDKYKGIHAATLMSETDIKQKYRELIDRYSREVSLIVTPLLEQRKAA